MRKNLLTLFIMIAFLSSCNVFSEEQFPEEKIKNVKVIELRPTRLMKFDDFVQQDLEMKETNFWSTINSLTNLERFNLTTIASSTLNNSSSYKSAHLCDGKAETAWVEGVKGSGIGEWVKISIDAYSSLAEFTSTPFSLSEIAVLPGYAKTDKTWKENNRVKKLLVVAHSPVPARPGKEWTVYRLSLRDEAKMQVFEIPSSEMNVNLRGMKKDIWIKIEEVYQGTKYDDTCISEFVAFGAFSS